MPNELGSQTAPLETEPPLVFIFLGASNLARSYSALVNGLRRRLDPRPLEFLNAMGPGRGYCAEGGIFSIVYPPIRSCGILEAVREKAAGASRLVALVTDIGNDIMYGVPPDEIIACLKQLFKDFRSLGAEVLVIPIPLDIERDVGKTAFRLLRRIFYPRSHVEWLEAAQAVREINGFLDEAEAGGIHLIRGMEPYCGADKIHYSLLKGHTAWSRVAMAISRVLQLDPPVKVGPVQIANALLSNLFRLFVVDLAGLRKKGRGFF